MTYLLSIRARKWLGTYRYLFLTKEFQTTSQFKKALKDEVDDIEELDLRTLKVVDSFSNGIVMTRPVIEINDDLGLLSES